MKLSLASVDASVLWLLAITVPAAIAFWCCKRLRKTVAVVIALAATLLVIGIPSWRDALASVATTPKSLAVLCVPFGVSGALFSVHLHSIRKPKKDKGAAKGAVPTPAEVREESYHHRWTIVLGIIAGTTGGMIGLDLVNVMRNLSKAPGGTATAWSVASKSVTSGTAAQAAHAGSVPPLAIIIAGVALLAGLIWLMGRHPHVRAESQARGKGRKAVQGGRQPAAIAGGQPGAGAAAARAGAAASGPPARFGAK